MRAKTIARSLAVLAVCLGAAFLVSTADTAWAQHDDHAQDQQEQSGGHGEAYPDDPQGHDPAETKNPDPHHPTGHGDNAHAADAHGSDAHGDDHGAGHSTIPHLPNALTFIKGWLPGSAEFLDEYANPIFSLFMAGLIALFFVALSKQLDARRPGRLQMAAEMILGGLYSLFEQVIGPTARRYTPYLGSLFLFIWFNNLFGLIPLGHAATSSFATTTFALGALTFLYFQGIALKENGLKGYLFHLAGSPKSGVEWGLVPLFFVLHFVGELIKPISLSLRLFGNIFGEDTLVATMVLLGAGITYSLSGGQWWLPGIPLHVPFYFLGLLSCTIQALVFTLLSTVYIALWLPHGDHGDEAHAH